MWHRDKFSSGLKVAPVLNLAKCQTFTSFRPHCIVLPLFWRFRGLGQCRNVCDTDYHLKGVEILAKMMQNGKKKEIIGTGINLALVLHLVQRKIYPGATFSTVPAKRYQCPSMNSNFWSPNVNKLP